jgi:hypothetical protein
MDIPEFKTLAELVTRAETWESIYQQEEGDPEHFVHVLRAIPALVTALEEAQAEIVRLKELAAYYPAWLPQGESE